MKKKLSLLLALVLCSLLIFGCQSNQSSSSQTEQEESIQTEPENSTATADQSTEQEDESTSTRTVVDMGGMEVELPENVNTVIDLWHANNQVALLLGGADKLIGTTSIVQGLAWYAQVYPGILEIPAYSLQSGSGSFNTEEILTANPDVVITSSADDAEVLRNAGITTVYVSFRDFEGLKETVRVTAEVLGDDAPERAEAWTEYFEGNLTFLSESLAGLSDDDKPKVYEIRSENPLESDGRVSICTEWIEAAGGINAIAHIAEDNQCTVTMEEILSANPDVIIVATQNAQPIIDEIMNDPAWSTITAVQNGQVYANPVGTFLWSRYSCEEALQVLWVAKTLHPDLFENLDMVKEVCDFYQTFYGYEMTEAEAELMLAGLDPQ